MLRDAVFVLMEGYVRAVGGQEVLVVSRLAFARCVEEEWGVSMT